jgi:hypothetical protein
MENTNDSTQGTLWDHFDKDIPSVAERFLGKAGRRLYVSVRVQRPTSLLDACIFDSESRKIWVGDIEISLRWKALLLLSEAIGTLYIVEDKHGSLPKHALSPDSLRSKSAVIIERGRLRYSKSFTERIRLRREQLRFRQTIST